MLWKSAAIGFSSPPASTCVEGLAARWRGETSCALLVELEPPAALQEPRCRLAAAWTRSGGRRRQDIDPLPDAPVPECASGSTSARRGRGELHGHEGGVGQAPCGLVAAT